MEKSTEKLFDALAIFSIVVLLLVCIGSGVYTHWFAARVPYRPGAIVPMIVPGPTIIVERQTYRERIPGANGRPIEDGFLRQWFPRHTRNSCDAECRAYRKAYANARLANKLLGEHRYREHA